MENQQINDLTVQTFCDESASMEVGFDFRRKIQGPDLPHIKVKRKSHVQTKEVLWNFLWVHRDIKVTKTA